MYSNFSIPRTQAKHLTVAKQEPKKPEFVDVAPDPVTENVQLRLRLSAMQVERDFWMEQARNIQNHLQTVLRGQANILEQMGRSAVCEDDVHAAIADMGNQLRQPLTTVEATAALAAASRKGSQGAYTSVSGHRNHGKLESQ